jgi:pimeloyl-ACP methyl ester carboxylesterase
MEIVSSIGSWITENESLLSGAAAIIILLGVVVSAVSVLIRRARIKSTPVINDDKPIKLADLTAPAPYPIQYAESDGLRIAFARFGKGAHPLIIAPGIISHLHITANLPSSRDTFKALGEFCDLVTFDKRGQGLSDRCIGVPSLEERVNDIEAVMDAASMDSVVLMGISEGAPMCIKYAIEHPERVKGLILFGAAARWLQGEDYPAGIEESELDSLAPAWGKAALRHVFFPSISVEKMDDQTYKSFENLIGSKKSVGQLVEFMKKVDVRDLLPQITCPTLILHFSGDMAIPVRLGRYMSDLISTAEYLELPGIDHADLSTSLEGVERVKTFVESLG